MRVVVADDTHLFRQGLVRLLSGAGVEVVAEADDLPGLLAAADEHRPDVTIVDVRMPPTGTDEGLRAAAEIRSRRPGAPVLLLSGFIETSHLETLLRDGGRGVGYLLKDRVMAVEQLVDALRRLVAGESALDPEVIAEVFRRRRATDLLSALTTREREVLELMAAGRSNASIAAGLVLSPKTVEAHISSVFAKLQLEPRDEVHRRVLAVLHLFGAA
jgi:DNA-binding NarL/FixJ family response regulator